MSSYLKNVNNNEDVFYVLHSKVEENIPMHSHNKHQLCYVEGGVAFLNTTNKSYFLPARHFLWIPAGIEHNVISRTSAKKVHNIFFPTTLFPEDHKVREREGIYPVTNLLMEMIYYTEKWHGEISCKDTLKYEFLIALKNIVLDVASNPLPIVLPTTNNENLRAVLIYIHNNLDQALCLDQVAANFGYSSRTLSRLFQKNIDTSFLQYVKLTRIIRSMEQLIQTDLSITEIAYKSGYNSLSAYSYTFQQIIHLSPAEFRKQNIRNPK
ncbi:helix-turn-helix domain-containing protein [Plebeiibacterium marinum]|uniref:AraC family transcriptional regulator n=1 Tax=Plebeiibacterium marinum TaxID=2992111 RepID=A0AAE3MBP2_9BACT|nr:AraC family transcriptional regulator [Plebeiobacterium marinum]MCW3804496.1 AraC family transcriptional regulator [Plebeiobacterium marinum]